jgi:hypothetical protein
MKKIYNKFLCYFTLFLFIYNGFLSPILAMRTVTESAEESMPILGRKMPSYEGITINEDPQERVSVGQTIVLNWIEENVFKEKENKCVNPTCVASYFLGAGRGAIFFKLGFDFGSNHVFSRITSPGQYILASILYAPGIFLPQFLLGKNVVAAQLNRLSCCCACSKGPHSGELMEQEQFCSKKLDKTCCKKSAKTFLKGLIVIGSINSAPVLGYLAYDKLHSWLNWGWTVPAISGVLSRTFIDYFAVETLAERIYGMFKPCIGRCISPSPGSREETIASIINRLNSARDIIQLLCHSQASMLKASFFSEQDTTNQLSILSHPEDWITGEVIVKKDSYAKKIFGLIGAGVGAYGAWVLFPDTIKTYSSIVSLFGGSVEQYSSLIMGLAISSNIIGCALPTLATWDTAHKFYDAAAAGVSKIRNWCNSWRRKEKVENPPADEAEQQLRRKAIGAAATSFILAGLNTAIYTELSLESLDMTLISSYIQLVVAVLSSFSMTFWSSNEFLLRPSNDSLIRCFDVQDPRTPLFAKIDKIKEKVSSMSDARLEELKKLIVIHRPMPGSV